jgi:hypothetical protein
MKWLLRTFLKMFPVGILWHFIIVPFSNGQNTVQLNNYALFHNTGRFGGRDRTRVMGMCHGFHARYSDVLVLCMEAGLDLREKDYY